MTHSDACIAKTMINVIENLRDAGMNLDTNIRAHAIEYLDSGTATCACPAPVINGVTVEELADLLEDAGAYAIDSRDAIVAAERLNEAADIIRTYADDVAAAIRDAYGKQADR